jgi:hypothetical protein
MQIQNSQSMIQHLESGGNFTLDKQGQLETQNAAGRFFQKIGDAFRSITSSGRAAIETRNAHLNTAMANMLRDNTLVNPARNEIPHSAAPSRADSFAARFGMTLGLLKFPRELRSAARNLGQQLLRLPGVLKQGGSAETRDKVLEVMDKIRNDPVVFNSLYCDYARTHDQLRPMLSEIGENMCETYLAQKDSHVNQDGIHSTYFPDASRGLRSINGQKPETASDEAMTDQLKELFPDAKIRSFISKAVTQVGLEFSLTMQYVTPGKTWDDPHMPADMDMRNKGMELNYAHRHSYDIDVKDGKASVKLEMDAMVKPDNTLQHLAVALGINYDGAAPNVRGQPIGGGRYTIEMEVDLGQDMTNRETPEFTLKGSRVPLPVRFQPPES